MYIIASYDIPIDDNYFIPEGSKLKVCKDWNEVSGFIAAEYRGEKYYFNAEYFQEIELFAEVV